MLQALAIVLIIGISCMVVTFIVSFVAIWLSSDHDKDKRYSATVWIALGFTSSALFFLILGGMVGTAGAKVAEDKINGLGSDVGVSAAAGISWVVLQWLGVLFMGFVLIYWVWRAVVLRKLRKAEKAQEAEDAELETRTSRSSHSSHTSGRSRGRHRSCQRCRSCRSCRR